MKAQQLILLGEFGRAQGLKGDIRLKSFTEDPASIISYNPLLTKDGKEITLSNLRPAPGAAEDLFLVHVQGIETREQAEDLNRTALYVERERLPEPEEDEFLLTDLIGLKVLNKKKQTLGTIHNVPNFGGGDLLEIMPETRKQTLFIPFTKAFVPTISLEEGFVIVHYEVEETVDEATEKTSD